MRKTTKAPKGKSIKKEEKPKDHTGNDFKDCDILIANIGGKKIELSPEQQKEIIEFIYAIGSREKVENDPLVIANMTADEQLRNALLYRMKCIIYSAPIEDVLKYGMKILCKEEESNMTVN